MQNSIPAAKIHYKANNKKLSSVNLERVRRMLILSMICDLPSRCPSLMTLQTQYKRMVRNVHFCRFRVIAASMNSLRLYCKWSMSHSWDLRKLTISSGYWRANCQFFEDNMIVITRWNVPGTSIRPKEKRGKRNIRWWGTMRLYLNLCQQLSLAINC